MITIPFKYLFSPVETFSILAWKVKTKFWLTALRLKPVTQVNMMKKLRMTSLWIHSWYWWVCESANGHTDNKPIPWRAATGSLQQQFTSALLILHKIMGNKLLTRECPGCFVCPFEKKANFCKKFQIFPVEGVKRNLAPSECLCLIRMTAAGGYTEPESKISISSRPASALMMPRSWAVTEGRLT